MKYLILFLLILSCVTKVNAQHSVPFDSGEFTNDSCFRRWYKAGSSEFKKPHTPYKVVNAVTDWRLQSYGGDNTQSLRDSIIEFKVKYPDKPLLIYFPAGKYFFAEIIDFSPEDGKVNMFSDIIIKGAGATQTEFYIDHKHTGIYFEHARRIGIEDITINRDRIRGYGDGDNNKNGGYNFLFMDTKDCWVSGVYSHDAFSAHVSFQGLASDTNVEHNTITGCTFNQALGHSGGEEGYGINFDNASDNLVENCLFNELRHSISFQQNSSFNVTAYNASYNTRSEHTGIFPAADMSFHGRFLVTPGPHHNLSEGNKVDVGRFDRVHGSNGAHNTFFRTFFKTDLYIQDDCYYGNFNVCGNKPGTCDAGDCQYYDYAVGNQFNQNMIGCEEGDSRATGFYATGTIRNSEELHCQWTCDICYDCWFRDPQDLNDLIVSYYHWDKKPEFLSADAWPYRLSTEEGDDNNRAELYNANPDATSVYTEGWSKYPCSASEFVYDNYSTLMNTYIYPSGVYNPYFNISTGSSPTYSCTVKKDNFALFETRDLISLEPGFTAELGSLFVASIVVEPCPSNAVNRMAIEDIIPKLPTPLVEESNHIPEGKKRFNYKGEPKPIVESTYLKVFPNPFTNELKLEIALIESEMVKIVIYNNLLQPVYTNNQLYDIGVHELRQSISNLPAGIYTLSFRAGNYVKNEQIVKISQ